MAVASLNAVIRATTMHNNRGRQPGQSTATPTLQLDARADANSTQKHGQRQPDDGDSTRVEISDGGWRSFLGAKSDQFHHWAEDHLTQLRFSMGLVATGTTLLLLRRFHWWNCLRNTPTTVADLVASQRSFRAQCAAVVPINDRIVLRCQHVPLLRSAFFPVRPVDIAGVSSATTTAASTATSYVGGRSTSNHNEHNFLQHGDVLLDLELLGVRGGDRCHNHKSHNQRDSIPENSNSQHTKALAEMLQRSLVNASPRPVFTARCMASSAPFSFVDATDGGGDDDNDVERSSLSQRQQPQPQPLPDLAVQATLLAPTAGMTFDSPLLVGATEERKLNSFLSRRQMVRDRLAHAAELGLSFAARIRLRLFGLYVRSSAHQTAGWLAGWRALTDMLTSMSLRGVVKFVVCVVTACVCGRHRPCRGSTGMLTAEGGGDLLRGRHPRH